MARFTILASGSSGNAALLEHEGFGLLLDCGLGPQMLAERFSQIGRNWTHISAVLLTHTHSDHWNGPTLAHLRRLNIPLYAHPRHHDFLAASSHYPPLHRAKLTRSFQAFERWPIGPHLVGLPVPVPHDSEPTFAFRIEPKDRLAGLSWSIGYASDLGHVTPELIDSFSGVDTLAVEFNHDVKLQKASRRPAMLKERVLGPLGHLSNVDAAEFGRTIADKASGGFRNLFQLHLSRDCNTPGHALRAAQFVWQGDAPCRIVTASQFSPTEPLLLDEAPPVPVRPTRSAPSRRSIQPPLPGFGPEGE